MCIVGSRMTKHIDQTLWMTDDRYLRTDHYSVVYAIWKFIAVESVVEANVVCFGVQFRLCPVLVPKCPRVESRARLAKLVKASVLCDLRATSALVRDI